MAVKSEKTPGQDLMSDVGIKSIEEDFADMEDFNLRISDDATGGRFWSRVPEYGMFWKTGPCSSNNLASIVFFKSLILLMKKSAKN